MNPIDYTAMYAEDEDFKRYIDRCRTKHNLSVDEALQHYLVRMAGRMYKEQCDGRQGKVVG